MDPSECLAGVMLAAQLQLLKNSVGNGNYVGTFAFHFGAAERQESYGIGKNQPYHGGTETQRRSKKYAYDR